MDHRRTILSVSLLIFASVLLGAPVLRAQDSSANDKGVDSGNYNIQQSVEFGYRATAINGNKDTYDTFVNLGDGVRLFDYTLEMRSLNHEGLFFDNLSFSNFGYGGDPNDVSRLHIDKNKWYEFNVLFRRDKNFWDYNLLANPLNPAALNPVGSETAGCIVSGPTTAHPGLPGFCSNPAIAETNSPHALDLVRRMQDYDLMLLPQSRVRFRLGFSHDRDEGPGFLTGDIGSSTGQFPENYSYTTNAYRAGVDFRILPRTTISYDQFLNYFKQDNFVELNSIANPGLFNFQTPNGTPVDMGVVWSTQTPAEALPCASPITNATTTPPTVSTACSGFVSYSQEAGRPRNYMPTERLRFQSNYFQKFQTEGSFGYSTSDNKIPDFNEVLIGWTSRNSSPGSTSAGPAKATRVSLDGSWSGIYSVTDKFRIQDAFQYNNWRIPGLWDSELGSLFDTTLGTGLGFPVGTFVAANCSGTNYVNNRTTCPAHTAASAADLVDAYNWNFLKQDMKSNTFQLDYDFTKRISAYIGHYYTHREIVSSSVSYTTADLYYPGGAAGTAANDFLAARGSCALVGGLLPATCSLNATTGVITYTPAIPTTPATYESVEINENSLLAGVHLHPVDSLSITGDVGIGYNDASYTRIDPRQVQSYKVHATYTPKPWATIEGSVEIHENRDNVEFVDNREHDRTYAFSTMLMPNQHLTVDFGYNYWDVYTQSDICFNYSISYTNPPPATGTTIFGTSPPGVATIPCPIPGAGLGATGLGALSTYASTDHFIHAGFMWKPVKRVTASAGYAGSIVRGSTIFLNPLMPSGTLDYNYQEPYGSILIDVYKGFSYKVAWNYYGFNQKANTNPFGLAAIPLQDFNGNTATFSFRYAF